MSQYCYEIQNANTSFKSYVCVFLYWITTSTSAKSHETEVIDSKINS